MTIRETEEEFIADLLLGKDELSKLGAEARKLEKVMTLNFQQLTGEE